MKMPRSIGAAIHASSKNLSVLVEIAMVGWRFKHASIATNTTARK
jgi:hypothetical protein